MAYEPLHHKYRPQTFGALVGQDAIATTLTNALSQRRIAPAYLFCGPRGTGKTSSARILAKSLNCISHDGPTAEPCGTCDICRAITSGSALDFVEIDAASNTGVDNIRELIERAQFAPVQCRYKVYVIDECLTGDTQVLTDSGLMRIDNPKIVGRQALSYSEETRQWEFKPVIRQLDQGHKQVLEIQTSHRKIRCTENHLLRTDKGWLPAGEIEEGVKILSPVPVDVERNWTSPNVCSRKAEESEAFIPTGLDIPSGKATVAGSAGQKTISASLKPYQSSSWDSSTAPCWGMAPSPTLTATADFLDWAGRTVRFNRRGWNTRQLAWKPYTQRSEPLKIAVTEPHQSIVQLRAIQISSQSFNGLGQTDARRSHSNGSQRFPLRVWPSGTWMMGCSASVQQSVREFTFILKGILQRKTSLLLNGSRVWATQLLDSLTLAVAMAPNTSTWQWERMPLGSGLKICATGLSRQWHTSLEKVVSVRRTGAKPVYDIEVEDNHNFVANGLLVHNCHMLSTAAFNALLKTLEEPPERVVFVLATTDPQRVLPTIISRCQRFDYRRIPLEAMVDHLAMIADKEDIAIEPEALRLVAQVAQGGLRDAESLLDQLSLLEPPVTPEQVWDLVGAVPERDLLELVGAIATGSGPQTLEVARKLMDRGREPLMVLQNLAGFYRDLLIAQIAADRQDLVAVTPATWQGMQQLAQSFDMATLLAGQQQLRAAEVQVKNTTQPRLWLEVTLMGLLPQAAAGAMAPQGRSLTLAIPASAPPQAAASPPVARSTAPKADTAPPPSVPTPAAAPPTAPPAAAPVSSGLPTAPPPADLEPAAAPAADVDLPQLWQQVLAVMQPFGTRALMNQQGTLLTLTDTTAHIAISSKPLFKMAQGRVGHVEEAFTQVLQRPIKVSLEIGGEPPGDAPPTPPPPPSPPPPPPPEAEALPPASAASVASPTTELIPLQVQETGASFPAAAEIESDLERAVKSFAQFFNGQVVNIDDESTERFSGEPDRDVPF